MSVCVRQLKPQPAKPHHRGILLISLAMVLATALVFVGGQLATSVSFAHPGAATLHATTTELLTDGGFEQSPPAWSQYSRGGYSPIATAMPHGGTAHFYACGHPNCDDRVWQAITVPTTLNTATLGFWVASSLSPFNLSGVCRDRLTLLLEAPDTTILATLWAVCHPTLGYTLIQIDAKTALTPYVGKQVLLAFRGTTTNLASTSRAYSFWFVDDVSLSVS